MEGPTITCSPRMAMKTLLYRLCLSGAALLLTGCASLTPIATPVVVLRNYDLGTVRTARVGEAIVRVQQAREVPTYVVTRDYTARGVPRLEAGMQFIAYATDRNGNHVLINPANVTGGTFTVAPDGSEVWFRSAAHHATARLNADGPVFRRVTEIGNQPGAFTAEMIYSGLAGNVLRAVYREYVDDLARPAFSQELQYDLNADSTLAYKSIRIRVTEATNSLVRYRVESDDDLPWLPSPRPVPASP